MKKFNYIYAFFFTAVLAVFPFYLVGKSQLESQHIMYAKVLKYWDVFMIVFVIGLLIYLFIISFWLLFRHGRKIAVKAAAFGVKHTEKAKLATDRFIDDVKSEIKQDAKDPKSEGRKPD